MAVFGSLGNGDLDLPKEVNKEEVGVWDMIIVEPPRSSFLRMTLKVKTNTKIDHYNNLQLWLDMREGTVKSKRRHFRHPWTN
ncbi:hypothetical protein RHMOL_Rhmol12G0076200 [Rhododendron molle]|uniref:Uncharacterized protein n=1 Tax=Rhododendron molle TaxID=49168 RepID=A0ACC0LGR1_RHOML|nr:hypothetical protein RHMOL_Rhmol12G0076200 [Rhododendron molle]